MTGRRILLAATLMALAASPTLAQEHDHGQAEGDMSSQGHMMQGMHRQMMGGGMMGTMGPMHSGPGMLLDVAEPLGLSAEQVESLTALRESAGEEHRQHMQAAMAAHGTAASALEGESPDLEAYEAALSEAAGHMVQAHLAMARTSVEARDLLTPGQRDKLETAMSMMKKLHGDMMQGGMMEGGMMEGGMMRGGMMRRGAEGGHGGHGGHL